MSKHDWEKNNIVSIFPGLPDFSSVLDVGCGLSLKSKFIKADIRVGVDIFPEYFNHIEAEVPYVVIKYDATRLHEIFVPKSFDLVIALDIIEHIEKSDAIFMIRELEKIARKAVILETPEGFVPQNIDILGWGGDRYQTHRSGWEKKELEDMGYEVRMRNYIMDDVRRHRTQEVLRDIRLMDAIKLL